MNGDLGKIYNKLVELETKQEERHDANIERMKKLDTLPCAVHKERMIWINKYLVGICGVIVFVVGWIMKLHLGQ